MLWSLKLKLSLKFHPLKEAYIYMCTVGTVFFIQCGKLFADVFFFILLMYNVHNLHGCKKIIENITCKIASVEKSQYTM